MPIGEIVVGALAGKTVEKAAEALATLVRESRLDRVSIDASHTRSCLISHIQFVDRWSSNISLLSLLRDKKLRDSFVELSLDVGLSRYGRRTVSPTTVKIDDILGGARHAVILGRPGAGKTTSLQRIAQVSLSSWESGTSGLPVVVRLRDLRKEETLVRHLLAQLGLDVKVPQRMSPEMRRQWERRSLHDYLNSISAVLLVDGLDEVQANIRVEVESELADLVMFAADFRVFLTCRTAEYALALPHAQIYTILPLTPSQVHEFAFRWLGEKAEAFTEEVARNPYAGSEVVPLTLAHLCAIFERDGELPPRPIDVYEQIVSLHVEEWDKQRQVFRASKYSDFSWRKKERFLQAAAYELAMSGRKGSFSSYDLERVYKEIAQDFHLPDDECSQVVQELESHTGLVHEVGPSQFEFVHLVIQEYLTAAYAHRKANAIEQLMPRFPNEMALVIAYSTTPREHLEIALVETLRRYTGSWSSFVVPFIARLSIERPMWRASPRLGWTVLAFYDQLSRHFRSLDERSRLRLPQDVLAFLDEPSIATSIRNAAAEAERFEDSIAIRLIPKRHASVPPALSEFLQSRGEAGIALLRTERRLYRLLAKKEKASIKGPRRLLS